MAKKKTAKTKGTVIYQAKSGAIELRGDLMNETLWATLDQIAEVFCRDKSVISRHLKNIFQEGELVRNSVVAKNATTATDGKVYQVEYFNLDVILSVGYRVNSKTATLFRQWATKTLRSHIVDGYTINRSRIAKNYDALLKAVEEAGKLLPARSLLDTQSVLELVKTFASTWVSLDAYDRSELPKVGATKKQVKLTGAELTGAILEFKQALIAKGEATELFGAERERDSITGIVGNVLQAFGGKDVYGSVEEKAVHLLYFIVKNHPFADGNKRSGAFSFVWFLRKAEILQTERMSPQALTATTLLVAESDPKDKTRVVGLLLMLLGRG